MLLYDDDDDMINILEVSLFFLIPFAPFGSAGRQPWSSTSRSSGRWTGGPDLLSALRLSSALWVAVQGVRGYTVRVSPQRVANTSPLSGSDFLLDVLLVGASVSTGLHDQSSQPLMTST